MSNTKIFTEATGPVEKVYVSDVRIRIHFTKACVYFERSGELEWLIWYSYRVFKGIFICKDYITINQNCLFK